MLFFHLLFPKMLWKAHCDISQGVQPLITFAWVRTPTLRLEPINGHTHQHTPPVPWAHTHTQRQLATYLTEIWDVYGLRGSRSILCLCIRSCFVWYTPDCCLTSVTRNISPVLEIRQMTHNRGNFKRVPLLLIIKFTNSHSFGFVLVHS